MGSVVLNEPVVPLETVPLVVMSDRLLLRADNNSLSARAKARETLEGLDYRSKVTRSDRDLVKLYSVTA